MLADGNNLKEGHGKLGKVNGETYVGEFLNDTFHGEGIFRHPNGDYYQG